MSNGAELLAADKNLDSKDVKTLPTHDWANPNKRTLPAPPAGLTWIQMAYGWSRHDVIRVNGL